MSLEAFPYLKIRWERQDNRRYYEVLVVRDLFGWVITRIWGRQSTSLGQVIHQPCDTFEKGCQKATQIHRQRQQRGYKLVNIKPDDNIMKGSH